MIDYFALALCHGLLLVALLRLARRGDVDAEPGGEEEREAGDPKVASRREIRANRRAAAGRKAGGADA